MPTLEPLPPLPFVSCVMITRNRPELVPWAVELFDRQTYPSALRELVVVDDGERPAFGEERPDLSLSVVCCLGGRVLVRYWRAPVGSLSGGGAMNVGCELADQRARVVVQWQDDDYQKPERIARQVEALRATNAAIVGSDSFYCVDVGAWRGGLFRWKGSPMLTGALQAFRWDAWNAVRFRNISGCEDTQFSTDLRAAGFGAFDMGDRDLLVYLRWPYHPPQRRQVGRPIKRAVVDALMSPDAAFYWEARGLPSLARPPAGVWGSPDYKGP